MIWFLLCHEFLIHNRCFLQIDPTCWVLVLSRNPPVNRLELFLDLVHCHRGVASGTLRPTVRPTPGVGQITYRLGSLEICWLKPQYWLNMGFCVIHSSTVTVWYLQFNHCLCHPVSKLRTDQYARLSNKKSNKMELRPYDMFWHVLTSN